jgi:NADH:ubiquinone oxidoreductase subunit 6 (subunit J)
VIAVSQAQAERGAVVPVNAYVVAVMVLAVFLVIAVNGWVKQRARRRPYRDIDRMARRSRL